MGRQGYNGQMALLRRETERKAAEQKLADIRAKRPVQGPKGYEDQYGTTASRWTRPWMRGRRNEVV